MYDGVSHPREDRCSKLDISTVGTGPVPQRPALEPPCRELSGDVSFGIGTLLVVEQSSLENRLKGGVMYTVVCGYFKHVQLVGTP